MHAATTPPKLDEPPVAYLLRPAPEPGTTLSELSPWFGDGGGGDSCTQSPASGLQGPPTTFTLGPPRALADAAAYNDAAADADAADAVVELEPLVEPPPDRSVQFALYARALAGAERVYGALHPLTGAAASNLGLALYQRGDYLEAEVPSFVPRCIYRSNPSEVLE